MEKITMDRLLFLMVVLPLLPYSCYAVCGQLDIVFLVDASVGFGEKAFAISKLLMSQILGNFNYGPRHVQVGVETFSNSHEVRFHLNTYQNVHDLKTAVSALSPDTHNYSIHIDRALRSIEHEMFSVSKGMREDAQKVVVIITSGKTENKHTAAAIAARLRNHNIETFVAGVNFDASDLSFLIDMAGDSSHFLHSGANPRLNQMASHRMLKILCSHTITAPTTDASNTRKHIHHHSTLHSTHTTIHRNHHHHATRQTTHITTPRPGHHYTIRQSTPTSTIQPRPPTPTTTNQPRQPTPTTTFHPRSPTPTMTIQPRPPTTTNQPRQQTPTTTFQPRPPASSTTTQQTHIPSAVWVAVVG